VPPIFLVLLLFSVFLLSNPAGMGIASQSRTLQQITFGVSERWAEGIA
jgi:hypothetical protein